MKLNHILVLIGSCICLIGTTQAQTNVVTPSGAFFVTIQWYGAQSKPRPEAGIASEDRKAELLRWKRERMRYRFVAIVSDEEQKIIRATVGKPEFEEKTVSAEPSVDVAGYVVVEHGVVTSFIPIGYNKETYRMLSLLRSGLNEQSSQPIRRIMDGMPDRYRIN